MFSGAALVRGRRRGVGCSLRAVRAARTRRRLRDRLWEIPRLGARLVPRLRPARHRLCEPRLRERFQEMGELEMKATDDTSDELFKI